MADSLTAHVALPVPVPRTFSYRIPSAFADSCRIGCRVKVPFGKKRLMGLVVSVEPEGAPRKGLREVQEVLDIDPVVDGELMELTRWLSEYYFAPWGLVIQAALPASFRIPVRRRLGITPAGMELLENPFSSLPPARRRILDLLARKGPLPPGRASALLPSLRPGTMREMLSRGWLRLVEIEGPSPGTLRLVEWALPGPAAPPPGDPQLSGARGKLLEALRLREGALPISLLLKSTGASRSTLRVLAKRHWVILEKRPPPAQPATPPPTPDKAPPLTADQRAAVGALEGSLAEGGFRAFLLQGVTGSGKTEVYLGAAESARSRGMGVLYLVPEIGLTPLLAERLIRRFPGEVAVLHSGLAEGERRRRWECIRRGEASLILGTRSALFAPHPRLGLIVIDEEQDPSYYQVESPRYHARDAALMRARRLGATAVLGSATPSLEAVASVRRGRFHLLSLPERVEGRPLPEMRLVDMREEFLRAGVQTLLSRELSDAVRQVRSEGSQALLLLNRRGFSTFILCRACGRRIDCPRCSIALTYHRREERLCCHYCNYQRRPPTRCGECGSPHLHAGGAGTERLEEALGILEPGLRMARMDRDTSRAGGHETLLRRFEKGEIDLMLGTQMLAKGHDFPGVTLVGILSADAHLALPDFRAAERTFQFLTQAAGRAGRGVRPGRVVIQAFDTGHAAIQAAVAHRPEQFYERELHLRKVMNYPPWVAITQVRIEDRDSRRGEISARRVAERLRASARNRFQVLGPAPAPFAKLKGEHRFQILLKGRSRGALAAGIRETLESLERSRELPLRCVVETDPRSLL
jgi:primosomal protein N' (replication factor Y) (superfamily II helicase)